MDKNNPAFRNILKIWSHIFGGNDIFWKSIVNKAVTIIVIIQTQKCKKRLTYFFNFDSRIYKKIKELL